MKIFKKEESFGQLLSWLNYLIAIFIVAGIILSGIAWVQLCSSQCAATHQFRLFGLPFGALGIAFFSIALFCHLVSEYSPSLKKFFPSLMSMALGSEIYFIYLQKEQIKHYCPVCLSIAFCVFMITFFLFLRFFFKSYPGMFMPSLKKAFPSSLFFIFLGFFAALLGVSKNTALSADEGKIKSRIGFGNPNSPIEVYVFTDWYCPACRHIEPVIKKLSTDSQKNLRFFFIDLPVHPSSLNYTPYNLSFMVHEKGRYFELRKMLETLADQTESPTEEDVEKALKPLGVHLQELSYLEIDLSTKYFKHLMNEFEINSTPSLVIINQETKKGKKLSGSKDINEKKFLESLEAIQS